MRNRKQGIKTALVLIVTILFAFLASAEVEVNTFSAHQVRPGTNLDLWVSVANLDEVGLQYSQSGSISIASTSNDVTLNSIEVSNPFETATGAGVAPAGTQVASIGKQLAAVGSAIEAKQNLREEITEKIESGYYELYDIPLDEILDNYTEQEEELDNLIQRGVIKTKVKLEIPNNYPDNTVVTIPVIVSYTQNGVTKTISTQTNVTVTNNPTAKRAIVLLIDGAKRDNFYKIVNQANNNFKSLLSNGVNFTKATTVFPSITPAAHASIFTGQHPKNQGVPAYRWYNKTTKEYKDYGSTLSLISTGIFSGGPNNDLTSETLFNATNKPNDKKKVAAILEFVHKGVDEYERPVMGIGLYKLGLFEKGDSAVFDETLDFLDPELLQENDGPQDFLAVWVPGVDEGSHKYGPNSTYVDNTYINLDSQLGRLINALKTSSEGDIYDETVFVITSDHGQTDVVPDENHSVSRVELEKNLTAAGYRIASVVDNKYLGTWIHDYGKSDVVAVPNAGVAFLYFKHNGVWGGEPSVSEMAGAINAFKNQSYVKDILVKSGGRYVVYKGGRLEDIQQSDFPESEYPNALERIQGLYSERSGDIVLVAKYPYYFDDSPVNGTHGNLNNEDSYVPLIISGPGIKKGKTITTSARTVDIAPTIANLLGASMSGTDGRVLTEIFGPDVGVSSTALSIAQPRCGQEFALTVNLHNSGKETAKRVKATAVGGGFDASNSNYRISEYDDIPAGETKGPRSTIRLIAPSTLPREKTIEVQIEYEDASGEKYQKTHGIPVVVDCSTAGGTPNVAYKGNVVRGDLECGNDNLELDVTLENTGNGIAKEVVATLSTANNNVRVWDNTVDCGSIPAGASKNCGTEDDYNIDLLNASGSVPFTLNIRYKDDRGNQQTKENSFSLSVDCRPKATGDLKVKRYYANNRWYTRNEEAEIRCGVDQRVIVELENTATKYVRRVSANLTTTTNEVAITNKHQRYENYGIISQGGTGESDGSYRLKADDDYEGPAELGLTIEYEDYLGNKHTSTDGMRMRVDCPQKRETGVPNLIFYTLEVDDDKSGSSYGNGNSIAECREHVEATPVIKNIGSGTAIEMWPNLTVDDPRITVIGPPGVWPRRFEPGRQWGFKDYDLIIPAGTNERVTLHFKVEYGRLGSSDWYTLEQDIQMDVNCQETVKLSKLGNISDGYSLLAAEVTDEEGGKVNGTYVAFIAGGNADIQPVTYVKVNESQPGYVPVNNLTARGFVCTKTGEYGWPCLNIPNTKCIAVLYSVYDCTRECPDCDTIQKTGEDGAAFAKVKAEQPANVTAVSLGGGMNSIVVQPASSLCSGSFPPLSGLWFVGLPTLCGGEVVSVSGELRVNNTLSLNGTTIKFA